jgi:pimeloyl-ACP methyl ester carboxylesterase
LSKGGGPFANATSTLPDMWGQGKSSAHGGLDAVQRDATHPVLENPGRMYMVLAAKRLAALVAMIHDYDPNETVTLVAHSQGCMVSLLAQAFLLQDGLRPADTLILNNPPYSLIDDIPTTTGWVEGTSGTDAAMKKEDYDALDGRQTLHARLQTLVNIVHGTVEKKHQTPALAALTDQGKHFGMVGGGWRAAADRDNRGKVYLYFCPEDMTVCLNSIQGIGWQGVPDIQRGSQIQRVPETTGGRAQHPTGREIDVRTIIARKPLAELGAGFFQRVFTAKRRLDPARRALGAVLVGQQPHDFILRTEGEDDQAHTEVSDSMVSNYLVRAHMPEPVHANRNGPLSLEQQRINIRTINGEALPTPVQADLYARGQKDAAGKFPEQGAYPDARGRPGAVEFVDPIDAAIAMTSDYGLQKGRPWQVVQDPTGHATSVPLNVHHTMPGSVYDGYVLNAAHKSAALQAFLNKDKGPDDCCEVNAVFDCMGKANHLAYTGQVLVQRSETINEARIRWQNTTVPRSFHGAIIGSSENHRQVTAYDVAIGGGQASSHPKFYAYLCAVADWRLKTPKQGDRLRPSILGWDAFKKKFATYWDAEPDWRKKLIEGNMTYYSTGTLPGPDIVPTLRRGLPTAVVCETMNNTRTASAAPVARRDDAGSKAPVPTKKGGA